MVIKYENVKYITEIGIQNVDMVNLYKLFVNYFYVILTFLFILYFK